MTTLREDWRKAKTHAEQQFKALGMDIKTILGSEDLGPALDKVEAVYDKIVDPRGGKMQALGEEFKSERKKAAVALAKYLQKVQAAHKNLSRNKADRKMVGAAKVMFDLETAIAMDIGHQLAERTKVVERQTGVRMG